ncbi:hypothetical protein [Segatella copri]|uniref:hypothetical protein n=1 Tax=Segatella copri TaxID=165179 RepID=UPI001C48121C|nr:hypothetical protein [Segatella copri]MBW0026019.1 hypothetical protein [Segatella copri]
MNQLPLSVYALFHSKNTEGRKIYSELYCLLCRDVKNPFMDGLDIPVFYATGDDKINRLVKIQSQKKVILDLLISICFVLNLGVSILMKS